MRSIKTRALKSSDSHATNLADKNQELQMKSRMYDAPNKDSRDMILGLHDVGG